MVEAEENLRVYLSRGGATNDEIDDFIDWVHVLCIGGQGNASGRRRRFCCYRLWAKLLRKRRTPYRRDDVFDYNEILKDYVRSVAMGDIMDAPPPHRAIVVSSRNFVKYVVRHLDDAL